MTASLGIATIDCMDGIVFDGQQTDERVLSEIKPHPYTLIFTIVKVTTFLLFFYAVLLGIASIIPSAEAQIQLWSTLFFVLTVAGSLLWVITVFNKSITYITDRRIIRLELLSPIYTSKRALFWSETLKAKGYSTNLIWRLLKIGNVQVEPQAAGHENVRVTDVYLFEDFANYVDKIIFITKNTPNEIVNVQSFVPKQKGERY